MTIDMSMYLIVMDYITVTNLIASFSIIASMMIWIVHFLKEKKMNYWMLLILANMLWMSYCIYVLLNTEIKSTIQIGMMAIVVDNIICMGIAVYGAVRFKKNGRVQENPL